MKLSLLAAGISILATLPQLYTTLTTGQIRDHHVYTLMMSLLANLLFLAHGYQTRDLGIMLLGGWFSVYTGIMLSVKLTRRPAQDTEPQR